MQRVPLSLTRYLENQLLETTSWLLHSWVYLSKYVRKDFISRFRIGSLLQYLQTKWKQRGLSKVQIALKIVQKNGSVPFSEILNLYIANCRILGDFMALQRNPTIQNRIHYNEQNTCIILSSLRTYTTQNVVVL